MVTARSAVPGIMVPGITEPGFIQVPQSANVQGTVSIEQVSSLFGTLAYPRPVLPPTFLWKAKLVNPYR